MQQTAKPKFFNEMYDGDTLRPAYAHIVELFSKYSAAELAQKKAEAETIFRRIGITFAVYGEDNSSERLIPFDMMPRVFMESEWRRLEKGVKQRARALNAFLWDVYHRGEIIKSGRIPAELVYQNAAFEPSMVGITPSRKIYSHILGIDLVRTGLGEFFFDAEQHGAPDHFFRELPRRCGGGGHFADDDALPHDRHPIRDGHNLA